LFCVGVILYSLLFNTLYEGNMPTNANFRMKVQSLMLYALNFVYRIFLRLGYLLDDPGFDFREVQKIFSSFAVSSLGLGPSVHWVTGASFYGSKSART
jgi:hypothetical protein